MENAKIVGTTWFTSGRDCIGIVAIDDKYDGLKFYIGNGNGLNEETDARHIADWGSHFPVSAGLAIFPHLVEVADGC